RWVKGNLGDLPSEGWFLLEGNPLPPREELHKIVADIADGRSVRVRNGQVRHLTACSEDHALAANAEVLQVAIQRLRNQKFRVAVHPGLGQLYQGQPLAIAFDPVINYEVFPDHPHLNTGGVHAFVRQQIFVPDTICYEEDIPGLGSDPVKRFEQTFAYLSVWMLRHMVWIETRKLNQAVGQWIGPQAASLTLMERAGAGVWNPTTPCRCGSVQRYIDCHLLLDVGFSLPLRTRPTISEDGFKKHMINRYRKRREQHKRFYAQLEKLI
ncbi:MAG: hypothetical protein ACYCYO_19400, partial [Bacilli bacterium]